MHSAVTGLPKRCDLGGAVHRRRGAGGGGDPAKEPDGGGDPVRVDIVEVRLNPRDSVMTNAAEAGGAAVRAEPTARRRLRAEPAQGEGDLVVYVSDNESWIDTPYYGRFGGSATETMKQWNEFKSRNREAKLVCIDLQPYGHTQALERVDILNVGGFSDPVFTLSQNSRVRTMNAGHWTGVIEQVETITAMRRSHAAASIITIFYGECRSGVHGERPFRLSEFKSHPSYFRTETLIDSLSPFLNRDECRNDYMSQKQLASFQTCRPFHNLNRRIYAT